MRSVVLLYIAAGLTCGLCVAQPTATLSPDAISQKGRLRKQQRVRYLLRQIDLTEEQTNHANDLLASVYDAESTEELSLAQVYALMKEMEDAKAAEDQDAIARIQQELRELGRQSDRDNEFFMNMEPLLTPEQLERLTQARERLERNPSGGVRPVDIFRTVWGMDLSAEQKKKFEELHAWFRDRLKQLKRVDDEQQFHMINALVNRVLEELTPEQQLDLRTALRRLRPDWASHKLRVRHAQAGDSESDDDDK